MWIFTKDGFYSVTQHKDDPNLMMIRTRVRKDLETAFGADDIIENSGTDYRFRKTVTKLAAVSYFAVAMLDIDYTSVKDAVDQSDPDRKRWLLDVWDAGWRYQARNDPGLEDRLAGEYEFFWKDSANR